MRDEYLARPLRTAQVRAWLSAERPDGSWANIPYDNRERSLWPPIRHLQRLSAMAVAYNAASSPLKGNAALKQGILRGLEFWLKRDPRSDNWWFNTIGMQRSLEPVLVLMYSDLPASDLRGGCRLLARSHTDGFTGANLVWEAGNLFVLGALTNDTAQMATMLQLISREIRVTTGDGVQPDWSFYQHGPQLNAGNYGIHFIDTCGYYASLVRGTPLALPPAKIAMVTNFARNFQDWVVWGQYMDLSSCGRELDRPGAERGKARYLANSCTRLVPLDPESAGPLRALAARVAGKLKPGEEAPVGERYFWRSDFMVYRPGSWYASVKAFSSRVIRTETWVNSENLKGRYLCDGVTLVRMQGDEYADIQPVWNWRKLPGTTEVQRSGPLPYGRDPASEYNASDFVGGVSDGVEGAAVFDLMQKQLRAHKAWFVFKNGLVCLGAGITSDADESVTTSINQCWLRGKPEILESGRWITFKQGDAFPANAVAVWQNGIGYVLLHGGRAEMTAGPQSGRWSDLCKEGVSDQVITKNVFSFWLNHGTRPRDASYAYAILPGATAGRTADFVAKPDWRILANKPDMQAVFSIREELLEVVFQQAGSLSWRDDERVTVNCGCLLMIRRTNSGIVVTVSDPTQKRSSVQIDFSRDYSGLGVTSAGDSGSRLKIGLPRGPMAGSSVTRTLTRASSR